MSKQAVVVGAGGISNAWFPPLQTEGVEVVGLVDLSPETAQAQINKYGLDCRPSSSLLTTLKQTQPDFVIDLTVPESHCAVTTNALRAGYHVIGEKPMASSMREARHMVQVAQETGLLYMVSQSRRWDDKHERLRQTVLSGEIGPLTTVNCDFYIGAHFGGFRDQMESPLILDMAIHHFDLARFLTGADPVAVYAHEYKPANSWYRGDVAASCIFEMTGGVVFTYRGSWCAEGCHTSWNGDWRLVGERGTLLYDHDQEPQGQVVAELDDPGFNRPLRDARIVQAAVPAPTMHGALLEMLTFLRTGERPQTACEDNIKSLAMVFSAMRSARLGRRVIIEA